MLVVFDITTLQIFCDNFVELLDRFHIGLEVERSMDDGHIALHFYDTLGRSASKFIKLFIKRYDYSDVTVPIVYAPTCMEKSEDLLNKYTKRELSAIKEYFDIICKISTRLNSKRIPLCCYNDDSFLTCLKKSYAKYGKRLKVVDC